MNDDLDLNLNQQFETLPKELQAAISAVDLPEKLQQIIKNNKVMIDKAEGVQMETLMVLLGLEPVDDYMGNLVKNVGLEKTVALNVAHDADELIFKQVRNNLKEISQKIIMEDVNMPDKAGSNEKENVLAGIENPSSIKTVEGSVSVSSMPSNKQGQAPYIPFNKGIEIRKEITPEIEPENLPAIKMGVDKKPFDENISPIANIVDTKMTSETTIPKKEIVIEEKSKLPEVGKTGAKSIDPYRESVN